MFRLLLTGTTGVVMLLALGLAGLAWWCTTHVALQFERTRLAQEVRAELLTLGGQSGAILREAAAAGRSFDAPAARRRMANRLERLRQANLAELALLPGDPAEEEEMHRLAVIEIAAHAALDRLERAAALLGGDQSPAAAALFAETLAEGFGATFRDALAEAIAREDAELPLIEAAVRQSLRLVAVVAQIGAAAALVVGVGVLLVLFRRLRRPLDRLAEAARAVAAGDLSRRVAPAPLPSEFRPAAESFNAMVAEVARSRAALEGARQDLERAVAARTAELATLNATLRESDAARRHFLADVSHELRTPLTVIRGEAEIALRGADRPVEEYRRALGRVAEEAALTAKLVDDLLFVARSEAGDPRIAFQAVALDEVVRRATAAARTLAAPRGIRVAEPAGSTGVVVQGDPERLRQIVLILLDNAVRYSDPDGEVAVTLTATEAAVELCIADTGMGIAQEEMEQVFERFFRGTGAASRHAGGSGLGLALARAIARAHGGEVTLAARPGGGTLGRLRLPAAPRMQAVA